MTVEQAGRAYMTSIHRLRRLTNRELDRAQLCERPDVEGLDAAIADVLDYRSRYLGLLAAEDSASSRSV